MLNDENEDEGYTFKLINANDRHNNIVRPRKA